jgi:hypothetical protein
MKKDRHQISISPDFQFKDTNNQYDWQFIALKSVHKLADELGKNSVPLTAISDDEYQLHYRNFEGFLQRNISILNEGAL